MYRGFPPMVQQKMNYRLWTFHKRDRETNVNIQYKMMVMFQCAVFFSQGISPNELYRKSLHEMLCMHNAV
ncbi:hypothetical protein C0J52_20009 [Blattella germanica]|nr:hypothetical protein C0J52_20009 [Blattella germanica]